ncbi:MAG: membrane protein insertion efficiency factor YidD [Psychrobacter sp.]
MKFLIKKIKYFIYNLFRFLIIFYQKIISPLFPARCRYYPTCSNYGKQALAWHGVQKGSWLTLKRICRCHPLGGHGIDFVPLPLSSYRYQFLPVAEFAVIKSRGWYVYRDRTGYVARLNHMMSLV